MKSLTRPKKAVCVALLVALVASIFALPFYVDGEETNYIGYVTAQVQDTISLCKQTPQKMLLFGSGDNHLRAIDPVNKCLFWKADAGRDIKYAAPTVHDDKVFIGLRNRKVRAFDLSTGEELWKHATLGRIYATIAAKDKNIYVGSGAGIMYALDADSGDLVWEYIIGTELRAAGEGVPKTPGFSKDGFETGTLSKASDIYSDIILYDDKLYFGAYDGYLYTLDLDGNVVWRFKTNDKIYSAPVIKDDTVYLPSGDGHVYLLDAQTGKELWKIAANDGSTIRSSPYVDGNIVYFASYTGEIHAYDLSKRTFTWSKTLQERVSWSALTGDDEHIYAGTYDGNMYALDKQTGQVAWKYHTTNRIYSSPLVDDGLLYFGSADRYMHILDAHSGELYWKYETKSIVSGSPTVIEV
jgi:eukaryotic-like serine/threonine-protein kinase